MVQPSRNTPAPRTSGGQFARKQNAPSAANKARPHHPPQPTSSQPPSSIPNTSDADFSDDGPPPKKRKLSIRAKQPLTKGQTTLDHFIAGQSNEAALKPPTSIKHAQPHGQLHVQVNGVRTAIEADEDHIAVADAAVRSPPTAQPAVGVGKGQEKKEEKRTLRSQDEGPRLKSELATYFPNYEDIVFDVRKDEEFVTVDTVLYVTDDATKGQHGPGSATSSPQRTRPGSSQLANGTLNGIAGAPKQNGSNQYNGCSTIDLDVLSRNLPDHPDDPLNDAHFFKSHRRAERREKQLRNIERERAMHEKVQLERLLDGLLGHDWLKVLGITGITDGEARKYEPKRDYFIAEVQALVDKFRLWKEEEKRQRMEREAAREAEEEESEGAGEEEEDDSPEPPSSVLNASASRQLQQETLHAVKRSGFKVRLSKNPNSSSATPTPTSTPLPGLKAMAPPPPPPPPVPYVPPEPITSFYSKRHLRDAALSKTRHAGRNITAFGHPLPDMEEQEFVLPEEFVSEDMLRDNARERRRRKRASVADAASGSGAG